MSGHLVNKDGFTSYDELDMTQEEWDAFSDAERYAVVRRALGLESWVLSNLSISTSNFSAC